MASQLLTWPKGVKRNAIAHPRPPPPPNESPGTYASPAGVLETKVCIPSLNIPNYGLTFTLKLEYTIFLLHTLAQGFIKLSVIIFYRRIFCVGKQPWFSTATVAMVVVVSVWTVAFFFANAFSCRTNFSAYWSPLEVLQTRCINTLQELLAFAISDFITDILILCMPIPMVRGPNNCT